MASLISEPHLVKRFEPIPMGKFTPDPQAFVCLLLGNDPLSLSLSPVVFVQLSYLCSDRILCIME